MQHAATGTKRTAFRRAAVRVAAWQQQAIQGGWRP